MDTWSPRASGPAAGLAGVGAAWRAHFVAGYDKRSLLALGLLIVTGGLVGYRWSDLLDANGGMDWLLFGVWLFMAAMLTWDVAAKRDLILLVAGLCGGGVIEWWGTNTRVWTYFTLERPPLWILPAWPIAALTIDRMARLMAHGVDELAVRGLRLSDRQYAVIYWSALPAFVIGMASFVWHTRRLAPTLVVLGLMAFVTLRGRNPRRDVLIFGAGSLLGVFLEYWGTSRECWTYYSQQIPPPIAIFAHGFAAVAFNRGAMAVTSLVDKLWPARQRQSLKTAS